MNWLLLRGWGREQRHWGAFPKALQEGAQSKVFCLDLPGCGTEWQRRSPTSITEIVTDVRERWTRISEEASGPWGLIGISMGGMVSLDWVGHYPSDFERIVLINSSVSSTSKPWQRLRFKNIPKILSLLFEPDLKMQQKGILELTTSLGVERLTELSVLWAQYAQEYPVSQTLIARQLFAASRFRPIHWPSLPALVLVSDQDGLVNPVCSERLAEKLKAQIRRHASAGHDLPLEDPNWIVREISEWMNFESSAHSIPTQS